MRRDIDSLDLDSSDLPQERPRTALSRRTLAVAAVGVLGLAWLASGAQGAALVLWAEVVIGLTATLQ
ncbi:MAG TPA: hypothetical protein PKA95_18515 [Thermomicrobiales bacterium]|nr:hypothetical protein [Thermomicrobiales bacterium]